MDLEQAIRTRRTHKAYRPEPLDRGTLSELFELANWAPNHHLTQPWRFRVVGPATLERLKEAAGPEAAPKLDRAPTLVACSSIRSPGDERADEEDLLASACAAFIVLLGAHSRGFAGYWRTPAVLWEPEGRAALGIPDEERPIGLLYLGHPVQEQRPPERAAIAEAVTWLE
jgi:nitroreductase